MGKEGQLAPRLRPPSSPKSSKVEPPLQEGLAQRKPSRRLMEGRGEGGGGRQETDLGIRAACAGTGPCSLLL